jgi:hypothetical protein
MLNAVGQRVPDGAFVQLRICPPRGGQVGYRASPKTGDRFKPTAKLGEMERDTKELLTGSGAIVLFGVALIVWPSFAAFVDHFAFSYFRDLINLLRGM